MGIVNTTLIKLALGETVPLATLEQAHEAAKSPDKVLRLAAAIHEAKGDAPAAITATEAARIAIEESVAEADKAVEQHLRGLAWEARNANTDAGWADVIGKVLVEVGAEAATELAAARAERGKVTYKAALAAMGGKPAREKAA